jgi:septum formation inhibitor MinC
MTSPASEGFDRGGPPDVDPTRLTTDVINQAKEDLRRELATLKDIVDLRVESLDRGLMVRHDSQDHDIAVLKELLTEKFEEVEMRFHERDVRFDQAGVANKEALAAALSAAKELNAQQAMGSAQAAAKSEGAFTKQFDALSATLASQDKAQTERLTELKERIDRGDGSSTGVATHSERFNQQLLSVFVGLSMLVSVIAIIVSIVLHSHT